MPGAMSSAPRERRGGNSLLGADTKAAPGQPVTVLSAGEDTDQQTDSCPVTGNVCFLPEKDSPLGSRENFAAPTFFKKSF